VSQILLNTFSSFVFYSGFVIYLCYGYKHSTEAVKPDNQKDEDTAVLQETPEIEHKITHPQLKLS